MVKHASFTDVPTHLYGQYMLPHLSLWDLKILRTTFNTQNNASEWAPMIDDAMVAKLPAILSDTLDRMVSPIVDALSEQLLIAIEQASIGQEYGRPGVWNMKSRVLDVVIGNHCVFFYAWYKGPHTLEDERFAIYFQVLRFDGPSENAPTVLFKTLHVNEVPITEWIANAHHWVTEAFKAEFGDALQTTHYLANVGPSFIENVAHTFLGLSRKYFTIKSSIALFDDGYPVKYYNVRWVANPTCTSTECANSNVESNEEAAWIEGALMPTIQMTKRTMDEIALALTWPSLLIGSY
jgi:hypothetical protein